MITGKIKMITVDFVGSIALTGTIEDFIESMNKEHFTIANLIEETDYRECKITKIEVVED